MRIEYDEVVALFYDTYAGRSDPELLGLDRRGIVNRRPIIGYTDTSFPEEIVLAAGAWTLLVSGSSERRTILYDSHYDGRTSYRARRLYDELLAGSYNFLDLLCVMGGDRWLGNTLGLVEAERAINSRSDLPPVAYIERPRGTFANHRDFFRDRLLDFVPYLESKFGVKVSSEDLRAACMSTNATRRILAKIFELRRHYPPKISGTDALAVAMSSLVLPKSVFAEKASGLLRHMSSADPQPDPNLVRVFVSGSCLDQLHPYQSVEGMGGVVVGEDFAFGGPTASQEIDLSIDPIEALADHYTYRSLDPWMLGHRQRVEYRVQLMCEAGAEAVLFVHQRNEDNVGWDWPDECAALRARGLHALALEDVDGSTWESEATLAKVEDFLSVVRRARWGPRHLYGARRAWSSPMWS